MKNFAKAFIFLSIAGMSFSCAKPKSPVYKDGTYTAVSEKDDWGGWADISITVQDKKIVDCVFYRRHQKISRTSFGNSKYRQG